MTSDQLFIPGDPVPKERPRARLRNGKVQIYTPDATAHWESLVGVHLKRAFGQPKHAGRLCVDLTFFLPRPKSLPARVEFPETSRKDVDNLAKAVLDAMQLAGYIENDNRVTDLCARKRFAGPDGPGVLVVVDTLPNTHCARSLP